MGLAVGKGRQTSDRLHTKPGHTDFVEGQSSSRSRRLGARLLSEISESSSGLHRCVVERSQLGLRRRTVRRSPQVAADQKSKGPNRDAVRAFVFLAIKREIKPAVVAWSARWDPCCAQPANKYAKAEPKAETPGEKLTAGAWSSGLRDSAPLHGPNPVRHALGTWAAGRARGVFPFPLKDSERRRFLCS